MPRAKKTAPIDIVIPDLADAHGKAAAAALLRLRAGKVPPKPKKRGAAQAVFFALCCAKAGLWLHGAFILTVGFTLFLFRTVNPGATTLMVYRRAAFGWNIGAPRYLPLDKIPKSVRSMAIRVEDGTFYEHRGILPAALKHAWKMNRRYGAPVYGGSTITMQTARTIFLVPAKSYLRKYLEAIIALEMELILGKDRILELYFNYAEWGKGIFGIEAASRLHYKAGVSSIGADRAVRLITLLASPIRHGPYNFHGNGILKSRYDFLAERYLR